MIDAKVVAVTDAGYFSQDAAATVICGRDVDCCGEPAEVVPVQGEGAEDASCED